MALLVGDCLLRVHGRAHEQRHQQWHQRPGDRPGRLGVVDPGRPGGGLLDPGATQPHVRGERRLHIGQVTQAAGELHAALDGQRRALPAVTGPAMPPPMTIAVRTVVMLSRWVSWPAPGART
ncbi:hypothetical protein ACFY1S_28500 [Micromonospora sp. NPDC000663]|uniref:hypothetical protein n=1 Tax=Micromonospora sp. NPDC000663 TaxID=3364218 RepID=UPI0036CB275D